MHRTILLLACLFPYSKAHAEEGHASATWVAEKAEIAAGSPIRTVIRISFDKGWHTYWKNPGEVGIPISLEAELPDGWKAGEIQYPAPHRITSSGMTSFCFEGEILLPLTITPPKGFVGKLPPLQGKLSWLACNDEGCVPGEVELALQSITDPETFSKAYDALPKPIPGARLGVNYSEDNVVITLTLPENSDFDPTKFEILPATRNIIAPAAEPRFTKSPSPPRTWTATAAKDEYLEGNPKDLTVVLAEKSGAAWSVSTEGK